MFSRRHRCESGRLLRVADAAALQADCSLLQAILYGEGQPLQYISIMFAGTCRVLLIPVLKVVQQHCNCHPC